MSTYDNMTIGTYTTTTTTDTGCCGSWPGTLYTPISTPYNDTKEIEEKIDKNDEHIDQLEMDIAYLTDTVKAQEEKIKELESMIVENIKTIKNIKDCLRANIRGVRI